MEYLLRTYHQEGNREIIDIGVRGADRLPCCGEEVRIHDAKDIRYFLITKIIHNISVPKKAFDSKFEEIQGICNSQDIRTIVEAEFKKLEPL